MVGRPSARRRPGADRLAPLIEAYARQELKITRELRRSSREDRLPVLQAPDDRVSVQDQQVAPNLAAPLKAAGRRQAVAIGAEARVDEHQIRSLCRRGKSSSAMVHTQSETCAQASAVSRCAFNDPARPDPFDEPEAERTTAARNRPACSVLARRTSRRNSARPHSSARPKSGREVRLSRAL